MRSTNLQQRTKEDEGINEITGLSECQGKRHVREIPQLLSQAEEEGGAKQAQISTSRTWEASFIFIFLGEAYFNNRSVLFLLYPLLGLQILSKQQDSTFSSLSLLSMEGITLRVKYGKEVMRKSKRSR